MSWWWWQSDEPASNGCGRITTHGFASSDCSVSMKYVCKKGVFAILSIITNAHLVTFCNFIPNQISESHISNTYAYFKHLYLL